MSLVTADGTPRQDNFANCKIYALDCSDPAQINDKVWPNPYLPFPGVFGTEGYSADSAPAVTCGGKLQNRSLIIFYDAAENKKCAAWRPGASGGCHWNATAQAFMGLACVAAPQTRCACLHLTGAAPARQMGRPYPPAHGTHLSVGCLSRPPPAAAALPDKQIPRRTNLLVADFIALSAPKISVCKASDLVAIKPTDVVTKIKFFFILVILLFAFMHIGGLFAFFLDRRDRQRIIDDIRDPEKCGFAEIDDAWTWSLTQEKSDDPVMPVKGTVVSFCACVGIPFTRIRSAIPEDTLDTTAPTHLMVGRYVGLSTQFHEGSDKDVLKERLHTMFGGGCIAANAVAPGGYDIEKGGYGQKQQQQQQAPGAAAADFQRMASTALVMAFLFVRNVYPPEELTEMLQKCTILFGEGLRDPSGKNFRELHFLFVALLHQDNMPRDRDWFTRARLWRLILLQNATPGAEGGSWDLRPSLAMALLARKDPRGSKDDCPLQYEAAEIRASLDEARARFPALPQGAEGERIWATLLVVTFLQTCRFSWLADGEHNDTIVDRGLAWLQANLNPDSLGGLAQLAEAKIAAWADIQTQCITAIRAAERRSDFHLSGILQHFVGEVVRMVRVEHESFGWLMAPVAVDLFRWQQFFTLCSMLMSLLVVVRADLAPPRFPPPRPVLPHVRITKAAPFVCLV